MLQKILSVLILTIAIPALATPTVALTSADAKQFVDEIGQKVLGAVNGSQSEEVKQKQLQQMFIQNVDIEWMGNFVLGIGKKQETPEQHTRYINAYRQYLLGHYTKNFSNYTGSNYTITDVKDEGNGEFSVNMEIKPQADKKDVRAGYRLNAKNTGQFKITDIVVEGVSLITTQRADFGALLKKQGMEGLIKAIEAKL